MSTVERKSVMTTRRSFLKMGISASVLAGSGGIWAQPRSRSDAPNSAAVWDEVPRIVARIKLPKFPSREFEITKYGAKGDNQTDNSEALHAAIAACVKAGGGRVLIPRGEFITGAIELKSNVNLHVSEGATLRFTRDTSKYPLVFTRWEGTECMNYSPFIYAFEQENLAITGKGTIDGNADHEHWWNWRSTRAPGSISGSGQPSDRQKLVQMATQAVPPKERVFGPGHYLRPQFIQPYRSKNLLIEGVHLVNSPMWQVTPCLCTNVTVRNLYIDASGPNTDGCDPESCSDVLIDNCFFNTGDDCIAIKSGRNDDGRRVNVPSQNIVIQGCHMKNGHGGVTIGSEISGGVHNVYARNCQMDSPILYMALRIKNNAARGGLIEKIYMRDVTVGQVAQAPIGIDYYYEEGEKGGYKPIVRDVAVENLKSQKSKYGVYLRGFKNDPITNISLSNCEFDGVTDGNVVENVNDISLHNVRINGKEVDRLTS
jgi:polygalacturonase